MQVLTAMLAVTCAACSTPTPAASDAGSADAAPLDAGADVVGDLSGAGDAVAEAGDGPGSDDGGPATGETGGTADADVTAQLDGDAAQSEVDGGQLDAADGADAVALPQCATAGDCPKGGPCTAAACVGGLCSASTQSDGTPCTAPDLCAVAAACDAGACKAKTLKACDDANPCTADACDPATGQCGSKPAAGGPCDDGNPCTAADTCSNDGSCGGGKNTCGACKSNYDCALKDDGNPCNGTLYCNDAVAPSVCATLPGSVPVCEPTTQPCGANTCQPATGMCAWTAAADGSACDDGDPCSKADACATGQCKGTADLACGCKADSDCPDDGNLCNGAPYCNNKTGLCALNLSTIKSCPLAGDACKTNACDPKTGQCATKNLPDGTLCSDGKAATKGDVCTAGACAGTDVYACKADGDCAKFEDGDYCNGTLFCNKASGLCEINGKTGVVCPSVDDTACSKNTCQPKTGKCAMIAAADGTVCSDGNACTESDGCQKGVCNPGVNTCTCQTDADCAPKEDGNLCNGTLFCDKSKAPFGCKLNPATLVNCPSVSDGPCATNLCEPKTGKCAMVHQPDGKACDADGNPCTGGDSCAAGQCKAGGSVCECQSDADCAAKDDGDLCNGTLYCDKAQKKCLPNPATVVFCTTVDDTACSKNVCIAKSGKCAATPVNQGLPCEDGNPLTVGDVCDTGSCAAGSPSKACKANADCQDTPNLCVAMYCDATGSGVCQIDTAKTVQCAKPGAAACAVEVCQPATGKCAAIPLPDKAVCSAGSKCASPGQCAAGLCQAGKGADCDDVNPCTLDTCDLGVGCVHAAAADGAGCNDGNACTDSDVCGNGQCNGALVTTDDGNACTADSCKPLVGVVHTALDATVCDDSNACTGGDACAKGVCKAGTTAPDCDDKLACTDDSCDPKKGCVHVGKSTGSCDDGNKCTVGDGCANGICTGSPKNCDDGDACTSDACDKDKGCQYEVAAGATCDDGDACTVGDKCNGLGKCGSSTKKNCNDNNLCTLDSCDPAQGCTNTPTAGQCDDGSACSEGDACSNGKCSGKPLTCNDNNPCTAEACDPAKGCVVLPKDASPCDDNNACTKDDACSGGSCAGALNNCDDGNPCTKDSCDKTNGCANVPLDKVACSDGSTCTHNDTCSAGQCTGKPMLWKANVAFKPAAADEAAALVPWPSGAALLGNVRTAGTFGDTFDVAIKYFDSLGNVMQFNTLHGSSVFDEKVNSAAVATDGNIVFGGYTYTGFIPTEKDGYVSKVNLAGQVLWHKPYGTAKKDEFFSVAATTDGGVAAIGFNESHSLHLKTDANGDKVWFYTTAIAEGSFKSAAACPGGSVCVAGSHAPDTLRAIKWPASGSPVAWSKSFTHPAGDLKVGGSAATAAHFLISGTVWDANKQPTAYVWVLNNATGALVTKHAVQSEVMFQVQPHPWGGFVTTGQAGGAGRSWWLNDSFGIERAAAMPLGAHIAPAADGTLYLAETLGLPGLFDAFIAHVDAFGNADCAASGNCASAKKATCDDGDPCTANLCSAKSGCATLPLADGALCGSAKTCKVGVCK